MPCHIIYPDFQKPFNKVPHEHLLKKLPSVGIGANLTAWIKETITWLTDRKERVLPNGQPSEYFPLTNGVLQVSMLGSILFTIYLHQTSRNRIKILPLKVCWPHQSYINAWTTAGCEIIQRTVTKSSNGLKTGKCPSMSTSAKLPTLGLKKATIHTTWMLSHCWSWRRRILGPPSAVAWNIQSNENFIIKQTLCSGS